jgi:hypothetical protein
MLVFHRASIVALSRSFSSSNAGWDIHPREVGRRVARSVSGFYPMQQGAFAPSHDADVRVGVIRVISTRHLRFPLHPNNRTGLQRKMGPYRRPVFSIRIRSSGLPLFQGQALSDFPPLQCRCRSRARASLRNRPLPHLYLRLRSHRCTAANRRDVPKAAVATFANVV